MVVTDLQMETNQKFMEGSNEDPLKILPEKDWYKLKDLYKNNWPYSIYPCYLVQNFIIWKMKNPTMDVRILCPKGEWKDGTMVLVHNTEYGVTLYMFTLEKSCSRLRYSLTQSQLIDWSKGPFLYAVHDDHWDAVKASLIELRLGTEFLSPSAYYWIPKEEGIKFEINCPSDVYMAPLKESDIPIINDSWPHKHPGSDVFLMDLINLNGGLGVYLKKDDSLCSWIMKNQLLGIGILQTLEKHKRKGYAKLLIKQMTKQIASEDIDVHCCIVRENTKSQTLFQSLGFRRVDGLMFEKVEGFNLK